MQFALRMFVQLVPAVLRIARDYVLNLLDMPYNL